MFIVFQRRLMIIAACLISMCSSFTKIILIGDSVDRISVDDWCVATGGQRITDKITPDVSTSKLNMTKPLDTLLSAHGSRRRAWELRICDSTRARDVVTTFVANKFGVKSHPPWHCPLQTTAGLQPSDFTDLDLPSLLRMGIVPGIKLLEEVLGGRPDGVLLHSMFWDLSHPDKEHFRLNHNRKSEWLLSWTKNVTTYMNFFKDYFGPNCWLGWRTGNKFLIASEQIGLWNTKYAHELLVEMNDIIRRLAPSLGYDVVEMYRDQMHLRDFLHPDSSYLVSMLDDVITRVKIRDNKSKRVK